MVDEYKVTVSQFLTRPSVDPKYADKEPVPFRIMFGYVVEETQNGIYLKLEGKAAPSDICFVCGRTLKHPVSLLYGIGPDCGKHMHNSPMPKNEIEAWFEELKTKMKNTTWEGWLPKAYVKLEPTGKKVTPSKTNPTKQVVSKPPIVDQNLVKELVLELGF
ncbi:hypothetical protein D3C74_50480 [compost metagenome]